MTSLTAQFLKLKLVNVVLLEQSATQTGAPKYCIVRQNGVHLAQILSTALVLASQGSRGSCGDADAGPIAFSKLRKPDSLLLLND